MKDTLVGEVLRLCWDTVGVFYDLSRLGHLKLDIQLNKNQETLFKSNQKSAIKDQSKCFT